MVHIDDPVFPLFSDVPATSGPKTVVICGAAHGGTTMVAAVTRMCGVDLGEDLPSNLEDPAFSRPVRNNTNNPEKMRAVIRERNASKQTWGWKFPRAASYLDALRPDLRDPHLIIVTRDPVATATRQIVAGMDVQQVVQEALDKQVRAMELARRWRVPTLLVSYEKSLMAPARLATGLADFVGAAPLSAQQRQEVAQFVKPGKLQRAVQTSDA